MNDWKDDWGVNSPKVEKIDPSSELQEIESSETTRAKRAECLITEFSHELKIAHSQKYDAEKAELTAALCLEAQKEIAEFLSEAELLSKEKKSEVESIQAERYFFYKENYSSSDKKLSEVALQHLVAKDDLVKSAKKEQYKAEADFNKWKNLFGTLKDGHVMFRTWGKGKNDW